MNLETVPQKENLLETPKDKCQTPKMTLLPRILQLCLSSSWGGLEMVSFELAQHFSHQGLVCVNCVPRGSVLERKLLEQNILYSGFLGDSRSYILMARQIRQLLINESVEVIVVQQLHDLWFLKLALWGLKKPRVVGFSHTFVGVNKKDILHRWLYKMLDKVICLTEVHKANLLEHLPLEDKHLVVIPNTVSIKKFTPSKRSEELRRSLGGDDRNILIGLVGRLDEGKGQRVLLEAVNLLKQKGVTGFKTVLVGEDTLNKQGTGLKLKSYVSEQGLEDMVVFTGFRKDIPEIMASLDILVMASDAETFGRVIIEGMAAGVPVVGTSAGGVVNIIDHQKTGLLVPPKNPAEMAKALELLISSKSERETLAAQALKKVTAFYSEEVVLPKIESTLGIEKGPSGKFIAH